MTGCIFCKIVAREAKAFILYEDDDIISFLPLNPSVNGYTLIAPKVHHADLFDTPEPVLAKLMAACKTHALHYREKCGASGVNLLHASGADAQQSVFHFHIHLLPRFPGDGLDTWPHLPAHAAQMPEAMQAAFRLR